MTAKENEGPREYESLIEDYSKNKYIITHKDRVFIQRIKVLKNYLPNFKNHLSINTKK